jgi:hypothetical protein
MPQLLALIAINPRQTAGEQRAQSPERGTWAAAEVERDTERHEHAAARGVLRDARPTRDAPDGDRPGCIRHAFACGTQPLPSPRTARAPDASALALRLDHGRHVSHALLPPNWCRPEVLVSGPRSRGRAPSHVPCYIALILLKHFDARIRASILSRHQTSRRAVFPARASICCCAGIQSEICKRQLNARHCRGGAHRDAVRGGNLQRISHCCSNPPTTAFARSDIVI